MTRPNDHSNEEHLANGLDVLPSYNAQLNASASAKGLTRRIELEGGDYVLDLMVSPTADLDGTFLAYDLDEGDFITVNGWCFAVTNEQVSA